MNTTATCSSEHSWLNTSSRRNSIESVLSIQGKDTDVVQDTSDTDELSDDAEYEPITEPEDEDLLFSGNSSEGSSGEIIRTRVIEVTVRDDGDLALADSEQTDTEESDREMGLHDYWRCVACHADNNNPLYRFCEKCFKVRKNFFPPRPKRKNKTKRNERIPNATLNPDKKHADSGIDFAFNSQESIISPSNGEASTKNTSSINVSEPEKINSFLWSNRNVRRAKRRLDTDSETSDADKCRFRTKPAFDSDSETCSDVDRKRARKAKVDKTQSLDSDKKFIDTNSVDTKPVLDVERNSDSKADISKKPLKATSDVNDQVFSEDLVRKDHEDDPFSIEEVVVLSKTHSDPGVTVDISQKPSEADNMCIVCLLVPKSGVFVHGRIAHICCCYKCAVKVWATSKRCPLCNCKVSNVLRAVM